MSMDETSLVLAMPRRELFRINGFTRRVDLEILASLADDCWYKSLSLQLGRTKYDLYL